MSKFIEEKIICNNCGSEFDTVFYESINATLNPELREKVINLEIFNHKCPHCNHMNQIQQPILYHDMNNKFMIEMAPLASLMMKFQEMKNGNNKVIKNLEKIMNDITMVGATSVSDLLSKIILLENQLDYKVGALYLEVEKQRYISYLKKKEIKYIDILDIFFIYENGINTVIHIYNKIKDEYDFVMVNFNSSLYEEIKNKESSNLNTTYDYIFNVDSAIKYFEFANSKEHYENNEVEFAFLQDENGLLDIAMVPQFNINKYNESDIVIMINDDEIKKSEIVRLYKMNHWEFPIEPNDLPMIAWKAKSIELVASAESNDCIINNEIKSYLFEQKRKDLNVSLFANSDVIAGVVTKFTGSLEELNHIFDNDKLIPNELISMTFKTSYKDGNYLNIYLSSESFDKEIECSSIVYKFDSLVELILNNPSKFKGLNIIENDQNILIDIPTLIKYKFEKTAVNQKRMKKLLLTLNPKEIEFLSLTVYEYLFKVYIANMSPKEIAKYYKVPESYVHNKLKDGYFKLKQIVLCNS